VAFEFEPTPVYYSPGGGAEQDPEEWWRALVETSRRIVSAGHVSPGDIATVCCSSTFSSTVVVDRYGNHLMNALTWLDSRGAPHVRRLMRGLVNIEGYSLLNAWRWIRTAGGAPALSGKDDMGHLLYVRHEHPEIYNKAYMFLGSKDYLNLRLTGKFAATFDSVALFWITDTRDINNIRYSRRLMSRLGVDPEKFPKLLSPTDILGEIDGNVADETGIPRGTPVVAGSPDLQSACVGSGAVRDFEGHIYIGTSSWILCHVPFKKTDPFHVITSLPSSIPGRYFCANEQDTAGGALQFLADNLLFDADIHPGGAPEDAFNRMETAASSAPAGSGGLIFTPWLNGEKTPVEDHNLRGGFYNISTTTRAQHFIRAVMEGVAFNSRWVLGHVEKFTGRRMDTLNIIGGGARSRTWCRIYADVLGRTIRLTEDPLQANARGAAFIASVATGEISFDDIPGLVRFSETFEPDPANGKIYDELFTEFINIYRNNRAMFRRLNSSR